MMARLLVVLFLWTMVTKVVPIHPMRQTCYVSLPACGGMLSSGARIHLVKLDLDTATENVKVLLCEVYCPFGWLKHRKMCYIILSPNPTVHTYAETRQVCEKQGGTLMNLHTKELNNMAVVLRQALGPGNTAIGLNDQKVEGDYRWGDGEKPTFFNWDTDEPGVNLGVDLQDCSYMDKNGKWSDVACTTKRDPILVACEKHIKGKAEGNL